MLSNQLVQKAHSARGRATGGIRSEARRASGDIRPSNGGFVMLPHVWAAHLRPRHWLEQLWGELRSPRPAQRKTVVVVLAVVAEYVALYVEVAV